MIFENKSKGISYNTYPNRKTMVRQIKLNTEIAEATNLVIEVFKKEDKNLKMNSSVIVEIAIKHYFRYLNSLKNEDEAIEQLKKDIIEDF